MPSAEEFMFSTSNIGAKKLNRHRILYKKLNREENTTVVTSINLLLFSHWVLFFHLILLCIVVGYYIIFKHEMHYIAETLHYIAEIL